MATDDLGNVQVDFAWGNLPMQPNDQRNDGSTDQYLDMGGNHDVNSTSWNKYPEFNSSHNYMVTDAEYLGGYLYEYTAYNKLEVGDSVVVSNAGDFSFTSPQSVVYADKLKFRIENELGTGPKKTGLRARVDKLEPYETGRTRYEGEGDLSFIWPSFGLCYNEIKAPGNRWTDMIEYLRNCGVNPERLREATFEGGNNKYDYQNGEYAGGIIFWDYIPADVVIYVDWETGYVLTGKDFDGHVFASNASWGATRLVNPESDLDLSFVAFTNDPAKGDTANWWF